jgi:hypothetical protein
VKAKVYMRVGQKSLGGKPSVSGTAKPNLAPLSDVNGVIPTVAFAVELDIPDALFKQAENVIATIKVDAEKATIAASVPSPESVEAG